MFEDWKLQTTAYIRKHIDRKAFRAIEAELDEAIEELSDYYTAILLENGVIDENGDETELDFDEDDLIDTMLARFLSRHPADDDLELCYATLIDAYLALVEESSEDA